MLDYEGGFSRCMGQSLLGYQAPEGLDARCPNSMMQGVLIPIERRN
jgi:hypothetical protein